MQNNTFPPTLLGVLRCGQHAAIFGHERIYIPGSGLVHCGTPAGVVAHNPPRAPSDILLVTAIVITCKIDIFKLTHTCRSCVMQMEN